MFWRHSMDVDGRWNIISMLLLMTFPFHVFFFNLFFFLAENKNTNWRIQSEEKGRGRYFTTTSRISSETITTFTIRNWTNQRTGLFSTFLNKIKSLKQGGTKAMTFLVGICSLVFLLLLLVFSYNFYIRKKQDQKLYNNKNKFLLINSPTNAFFLLKNTKNKKSIFQNIKSVCH